MSTATQIAMPSGLRVVERLSRGHVLDVHAVWSEERDCLCVAKTLRPDRLGDAQARDQLLREGELLTSLAHPHLVRGYDVLGPADAPVVVMETLTGATLSHVVSSQGTPGLDGDDVVLLGRQLCSVLGYLHACGLVHLDLKPSNVVVQGGRAVLIDLSLAQSPGPCSPGAGTQEYLAPEQASGEYVDAATDVWGLGGVLYRAITGARPFARAADPAAPRTADLSGVRRAGVDPLLQQLVARCLSPDRTARPSIAELREVLDTLAG